MTEDRDYDSDAPDNDRLTAARALCLVAMLPVLLVAGVVLAIGDLVAVGEQSIRRRLRS